MPANKKLLILPGDGIGPEVMREVRRIIDWMDRRRMVTFDVTEDLVGGAAIDARKTPITDATIAYSVGGILEVIDAPTLIVNRELAVWYREAESNLAVAGGTYVRRSVPDEVNA